MSARFEFILKVLGFAVGACLANALLYLLLKGLLAYFESVISALVVMGLVLFAIPLTLLTLGMIYPRAEGGFIDTKSDTDTEVAVKPAAIQE